MRHTAVSIAFAATLSLANCKGFVREMWERAMRAGIVAGCVALAVLLSGCDPNDRNYFRGGIGTQLYTAETASATEFQNIYLDYLCRQSISSIGADAPGCAQVVPANAWPVIVQAGLNDIDARCDSYLAWLDQKRRENAAILAEISAVRFAVDALTNPNIAGVSGVGLAAISAAFGLATSTVNNFNSLLLQVDHTTVQTVVIGNRHAFRQDLLRFSSSIDNKPLAIHTMRTYLSICMPMTIAANINSTVTVFKQTGIAPGAGPVLPTVGVPFTPRERFVERKPPDVDRVKTVPGAETIIDGYPANRLTYTPEVIDNILVGLCAPQSELTQITGITKALLNIWEQTDTQNSKLDGKIGSDRERRAIIALTPCPTGTLNAFERRTFVTGPDVALLVTLLNKVPLSGELPAAATLSDSRNRIALVRRSCFAGKLSKLPDSMNSQVTPDLMRELGLYARRRAAETPAAPGGGQPAPTTIPAC
ncbi:hypothetical protein [Bradyrhizobium algeriense]|uniref:hypothetical protein n=1 Tax=Bradyrhizobium algeriense TaxID=634784 RepID=UPI000D353062|nr:hypothetical protein [Bradyrhizobium algeriense]